MLPILFKYGDISSHRLNIKYVILRITKQAHVQVPTTTQLRSSSRCNLLTSNIYVFSDAPICYPIQSAEYGVGRGEEVSVTCQVEANPPNVEFTWKFNNTSSSTKLSKERIRTDGTRSIAVFTPITEFDYGILYCWAENSLGFQKNPCIYKITPAGECSVH